MAPTNEKALKEYTDQVLRFSQNEMDYAIKETRLATLEEVEREMMENTKDRVGGDCWYSDEIVALFAKLKNQ